MEFSLLTGENPFYQKTNAHDPEAISRDYVQEGLFSKIVNLFKTKVSKILNALGFGSSTTIKLGIIDLSEESNMKGANGLIAEYVCAYELATTLQSSNLEVTSDISELQLLMNQKIKQFEDDGLDSAQTQRAINQGKAIAQSMYESIIADGKDLIFTEYQFRKGDHSYDVIPVGADTSRSGGEDMELVVTKKGADEVSKRILVSLKAYAGSKTSLGSNTATASLRQLFLSDTKKSKKQVQKEFLDFFGPLGEEMLDSLEDFKNLGIEYMNSNEPGAQDLRDYWNGKGKKPNKKGLYSNNLRRKELGDYYAQQRGIKHEHKLSKLFVELYNTGKTKLKKSGDQNKFRVAMMRILGVDDSVVTYNAIANSDGHVSEVVNSNVSDSYRRLYSAIANGADVQLSLRDGKGGSTAIEVVVDYEGQIINGLKLAMWKDGTIQFSFDSKAK